MHSKFLMANEIPGGIRHYLMITCGPVSIADRMTIRKPPSILPMEPDQSRRCTVIGNASRGAMSPADRFDQRRCRQLPGRGALSQRRDARESPRPVRRLGRRRRAARAERDIAVPPRATGFRTNPVGKK